MDIKPILPTNGQVQPQNTGTKRSMDNGQSPAPKRHKLNISHDLGSKNPVAVLNELRTGLVYAIKSQTGPVHAPVFTIHVKVDGHIYTGTGRNKKLAKQNAAENALKSFIQFPSNCNVVTNVASVSSSLMMDFTSDLDTSQSDGGSQTSLTGAGRKRSMEKGNGKSAVMLVNELYINTKYVTVETDNAYARFKTVATIDGQEFIGTGSNKRLAKLAACSAALAKLLASPIGPKSNLIEKRDDQSLADLIGRLVNDTFISVMRNQATYARRKVLAGIVMQRPARPLQVIAVTTGTKCISGEHISINGRVLNDMHAEIIARRVLVHYLFGQMEILVDNGGNARAESIFEVAPPHQETVSMEIVSPEVSLNDTTSAAAAAAEEIPCTPVRYSYRLKEGVKFHLYINTAPCGDGRIFSPHEEVCQTGVDNHPNRASRGQLRTKIESGEGTVPIKGEIIQTWDGVLLGTRLLTMSCSDKIARWNVLGIQGALLSTLIPPIYLSSVVLASLFHERHLYRALCGRIEPTLQGLPPPYMLNRPQLNTVTSCENRQPTKAPNFSINWMSHEPVVEIVNTVTGRPDLVPNSTVNSRLCKHALYKRFLDLTNKLPATVVKLDRGMSYGDFKQTAVTYQTAKEHLYDAFSKGNLGTWVKKPMEQDQFIVDD